MVLSGILQRNKAKRFRRKKLIEANIMLKYKFSQMPNVMYLEAESGWVKQELELNMEFYYKKGIKNSPIPSVKYQKAHKKTSITIQT